MVQTVLSLQTRSLKHSIETVEHKHTGVTQMCYCEMHQADDQNNGSSSSSRDTVACKADKLTAVV